MIVDFQSVGSVSGTGTCEVNLLGAMYAEVYIAGIPDKAHQVYNRP